LIISKASLYGAFALLAELTISKPVQIPSDKTPLFAGYAALLIDMLLTIVEY
jgi:hypothetical protein